MNCTSISCIQPHTNQFSFPYNSSNTYSVYLEAPVIPQPSGTVACKADCSNVPDGSGWYVFAQPFFWNPTTEEVPCPSPTPCNYNGNINQDVWFNLGYDIAVDPANIIHESWSSSGYNYNTTYYYWRVALQNPLVP